MNKLFLDYRRNNRLCKGLIIFFFNDRLHFWTINLFCGWIILFIFMQNYLHIIIIMLVNDHNFPTGLGAIFFSITVVSIVVVVGNIITSEIILLIIIGLYFRTNIVAELIIKINIHCGMRIKTIPRQSILIVSNSKHSQNKTHEERNNPAGTIDTIELHKFEPALCFEMH